MANMRTITFDGIVIGGGGAGMRAALQMAQSGFTSLSKPPKRWSRKRSLFALHAAP